MIDKNSYALYIMSIKREIAIKKNTHDRPLINFGGGVKT